MGWDDSDEEEWGDEDIEKKLEEQQKEKERQRRRDAGESSESEKEEVKAAPKPKPKPKPKPQPKEPEKVLTAEERKLLQRKMEEEADNRLAGDLFSGFQVKDDGAAARKAQQEKEQEEERRRKAAAKPIIVYNDAFDKLELKVQDDVTKLNTTCLEKIDKGKAKGSGPMFCSNLLKQLEDVLTQQELGDIQKVVDQMVKDKKVQKGETLAKDNKANTKLSKTTKFNAASEWEEVYGGGEGDEEWTQEEWDEWYAQQEGYGGGGAPKRATGAKW